MTKKNWRDLENRIDRLKSSLRKRYLKPLMDIPTSETPKFEKGYSLLKQIGTYNTEYTFGDNTYDAFFDITESDNNYLGSIGIGIADTIGPSAPKHVSAFEVWLFDKNDICTVTNIILSEHAYKDKKTLTMLGTKGECYPAIVNGIITLDSQYLYIEAQILGFEYVKNTIPSNSYFENISFGLTAWQKIK